MITPNSSLCSTMHLRVFSFRPSAVRRQRRQRNAKAIIDSTRSCSNVSLLLTSDVSTVGGCYRHRSIWRGCGEAAVSGWRGSESLSSEVAAHNVTARAARASSGRVAAAASLAPRSSAVDKIILINNVKCPPPTLCHMLRWTMRNCDCLEHV